MEWEKVTEKQFNARVDLQRAICFDELGAGRYATYYNIDNYPVARIDQSLSVFEVNTTPPTP